MGRRVWCSGFGVDGLVQGFELRETNWSQNTKPLSPVERRRAHVETPMIYELGFNQNFYTLALILLIKIVMCSKFH